MKYAWAARGVLKKPASDDGWWVNVSLCLWESSKAGGEGLVVWAVWGPLFVAGKNNWNISAVRDAGVNKHKFSIFCMMRIHLWSPGVTNKRLDVLFQIYKTGFALFPIEIGCAGSVGLGCYGEPTESFHCLCTAEGIIADLKNTHSALACVQSWREEARNYQSYCAHVFMHEGETWVHIRSRCLRHGTTSATIHEQYIRKEGKNHLFHSNKPHHDRVYLWGSVKCTIFFRKYILFYVCDFQVFFYWPGGLLEWVIDIVMASSSPV